MAGRRPRLLEAGPRIFPLHTAATQRTRSWECIKGCGTEEAPPGGAKRVAYRRPFVGYYRMTLRILLSAAVLLGLTAGLLEAQPRGVPVSADQGPVETLLEYRAQLNLTAQQVTRLEGIGREMAEANLPLASRLMEIRRAFRSRSFGPPDQMTPEERARFDAYLAEARPLMERIEGNNREAMRRVSDVLTQEQKEIVIELLRSLEQSSDQRSRLPGLPGRGG
jgi:hypothetical protein